MIRICKGKKIAFKPNYHDFCILFIFLYKMAKKEKLQSDSINTPAKNDIDDLKKVIKKNKLQNEVLKKSLESLMKKSKIKK